MEHVGVIAADDEAVKLLVDCSALLAGDITVMAVLDVGAGDHRIPFHQRVLDKLLYFLNGNIALSLRGLARNINRDKRHERLRITFPDRRICPAYRGLYPQLVKLRDAPVALYNLLHATLPPCRSRLAADFVCDLYAVRVKTPCHDGLKDTVAPAELERLG